MSTLATRPPYPPTPEFRWTRERYYAMIDAGIIDEREKLELIGGQVTAEGMRDKMPHSSAHYTAVYRTERLLSQLFGKGHVVRSQAPLSLGADSDPEPDVAVVSGAPEDYAEHHPSTAVLVVEVSISTLRFDRGAKMSLYASAGITEYWILNIAERVLEVYREPIPSADDPFGYRYASTFRVPEGSAVTPVAAPAANIPVLDLLP